MRSRGGTGSVQSESGAADAIADFFESEFLKRCNVDPFTGELARRLRLDLGSATTSAPRAWRRLATALLTQCYYLMTHERRLHKLNGHAALSKLRGPPARPWDARQLSLNDVDRLIVVAPIVSTTQSRTGEI